MKWARSVKSQFDKRVLPVVQAWGIRTKQYLCVITAAVLVLFIVVTILERQSDILTQEDLKRPEYGQEAAALPVVIHVDEGADVLEAEILLKPREYSEKQAFEWIHKVLENMDQDILGENECLDEVTHPLNLFREKAGTPVTVRWYTDNFSLVDYDGNVHNEELKTDTGEKVQIAAILSCGEYCCEYVNEVTVFPKKLSDSEMLMKKIEEAVEEAQRRDEAYVSLPDSVLEHSIAYTKRKTQYAPYILLLGAAAGAAVVAGEFRQKKEKEEKRKRQLQYDYSEVVSKLTLLMGAGMTIRMAWERIVTDYRKQQNKTSTQTAGGKKRTDAAVRYVYEEMDKTLRLLKAGVPEIAAYERFGRWCNTKEYIKFSLLITQNIKKGSKDLTRLLEAETIDAFESRKNLAVKYGEEAGTKLLIPMIMMLVIVMAIIMIPAMTNF